MNFVRLECHIDITGNGDPIVSQIPRQRPLITTRQEFLNNINQSIPHIWVEPQRPQMKKRRVPEPEEPPSPPFNPEETYIPVNRVPNNAAPFPTLPRNWVEAPRRVRATSSRVKDCANYDCDYEINNELEGAMCGFCKKTYCNICVVEENTCKCIPNPEKPIDIKLTPVVDLPKQKPSLIIPASMQCPITHEIFKDPVIVSSGQTYERCAIIETCQTSGSGGIYLCPITRKILDTDLDRFYPHKRQPKLTTNYALKNSIAELNALYDLVY